MKAIQYTIRNIPPEVDKALRRRAQKQGKSVNSTTVELLSQAVGKTKSDELEWFYGKKTIDNKDFDGKMKWLDSLPKDL